MKIIKIEQGIQARNDQMPDIDCDFPTEYRDIVKEYIAARYGRNHTCSIGTYTRLKLKTCIKDFAKLKGLSFDYTNKLTKNIDDQVEYTWGDLIEYACNSKMLFEFVQQYPEIVHLTKYALLQPKTESVHPSAVVIVPDKDSNGNSVDLYGWLPIKQIDGLLVSEWEGKYIDKSGFLKEDILGLSQLDKFSSMLKLIKKNCGKWIDVNKIPFDDQEVFKYFRRGWCEDVFQFGSNGLMNYCRQAKPNTLEDLIAMNALFRPGPMDIGAHQDFVDFKNGKKKPQYDYAMDEVTKNTFGLYVYQEQIMKAVVVAGLSQVQSDVLRTTIKKKDFNTLNSFKEQFIDGYVKLLQKGNIKDPEKYADKVWNKLLSFAGYGFNKCLDEDECILKFGYNDGMYVPTIGEMYKIMHMSAKEAKECGHASLRKKYNKSGYGMCLSLSKDNKRIKKNKIVDITPSGFRKVYNVTTETGRNIRVTMNHKFPTPNGEKMLCELKVGDVLYCIGDYEITPYIKTGGNSGNFPKKGQSGFQKKVGYVRTNLFKDFRKKHIGCSCEICGRKYDEDSRFEVHHRNKNRNNNLERNLIWLCNSCHKKIHYEELNRVKVGEKGYFVNQEKIISIDYCGYKQTYNVEVSGDVSHTFLNFEGIVTSNSHAAAYTIMGYWSQWFKVNYPLEFWTTSLQFATEAEVPYRLAEMKKTGVDIEIRPPDVNYSEKNFTCDAGEQRIFFSINKIKQVGDVAVENILKTREEGGRFFSLEEFCSRVPKKVNKRIIVHLIIAGAFDMIEDIRNPRERRKLLQQYLESKGDKLPEAYRGEEAQTNAFWILEQKKLTGFGEIDYESMIRESIPNKRVAKMYVNDIEFLGAKENDEVTIAGRLMYYHENETKNGTMCGMQIDCNNTIIYFTAWPDFYKDIKDEIEDIKGCLIAVCGTVKKDKFKGDKRVYSNNGTRLFIINSKID